jgi:hypothetical protein
MPLPRFRLRTLLIAVAVVALTLGLGRYIFSEPHDILKDTLLGFLIMAWIVGSMVLYVYEWLAGWEQTKPTDD